MQAIILAGGFGTRLQGTIGMDVPKPMAPVGGEPLLAHTLRYLRHQGVREVMLAVHHRRESIIGYFGSCFETMHIAYAEEEMPLGTGGALQLALARLRPGAPVLVLNGDSFVALDVAAMMRAHRHAGGPLTIALKQAPDCRRYGQAQVDAMQRIAAFAYPGASGPGWISTGAYIVNPDIFDGVALPEAFSFEADFQRPMAHIIRPLAWLGCSYFIDIGIPEDYARAQIECAHWQLAEAV